MAELIEKIADLVMVLDGYPVGALILAVLVWIGRGPGGPPGGADKPD